MKNILIISTNREEAQELANRYQESGYYTSVAQNASQAVQFAAKGSPNLFLLETCEDGSHFTIARELHAESALRHIPLILLVPQEEVDDCRRSIDLARMTIVAKPYDFHDLLDLTKRLIEESKAEVQAHSAPPRGPRILIIEDDAKIAKALSLRFNAAGFQTEMAFDALLGVQAAVRSNPDLVVLDISMPAGNGFIVAEKIRKLLPNPPPMIFLTASKQPDFRERAEELGASAFFEKPYEPDELMETTQRLFAKAASAN